MGFFKSLKGKSEVGTDSSYQSTGNDYNSQYTSGSHDELSTANEKRRMFGLSSRSSQSQSQSQHQTQTQSSSSFTPTGGPPPSSEKHSYVRQSEPPSYYTNTSNQPAPYHDWTSVPDTSLLPPPPGFSSDLSSSTGNHATTDSAAAAYDWCDRYPPYPPNAPTPDLISASNNGHFILERPETFARNATVTQLSPNYTPGHVHVRTKKGHRGAVLLSNLPAYFAAAHNPLHTEVPKTIYFEVSIKAISDSDSEAGIGLGFAAKPYPPWRLPGCNRMSIGVHSDNGRRYIYDSGDGIEFVTPFKVGDVVGLGMRFSTEATTGPKSDVTVKTSCFFTRNGSEEGSWNMDEERDSEESGDVIDGLEGDMDLYVAVGLFGGVEFEVHLGRDKWLYNP